QNLPLLAHPAPPDSRPHTVGSTPPSARRAAPLVAEDSGLARYATRLAISLGAMKRCSSDVSRTSESRRSAAGIDCAAAIRSMLAATPSEYVGPPSTVFTVTSVPRVSFARPLLSASAAAFVAP